MRQLLNTQLASCTPQPQLSTKRRLKTFDELVGKQPVARHAVQSRQSPIQRLLQAGAEHCPSVIGTNSATSASFAAAQPTFREPLLAASGANFAQPLRKVFSAANLPGWVSCAAASATPSKSSRKTIGQGTKTLTCILFTKLNTHPLLERLFLDFPGYSLTVTQLQANATTRLHNCRSRSHFSSDAERIYEKTCCSHTSSILSTVTVLQTTGHGRKTPICILFTKLNTYLLLERVFLNVLGYSLTVTQMQANATKRLHNFRNRSHFPRDAFRIKHTTRIPHR
ncbi:hypothetical protein CSKR_114435 [Clonorchis sinensis]|uniref:Uncharacterized protein n=1 Tax=Clonorchis sinensis TaxID=79923 RepID=A0A3R7JIA1_CLOSI|nr:hypothetical protein CSKR_114435 [Clonorchis sinensis]